MRPAIVSALALLVACTDPVDDKNPTDTDTGTAPAEVVVQDLPTEEADWIALLEARGSWNIGTMESSTTYDDPVTDAPRTLRLVYWYPTEDEGLPAAVYGGPQSATDAQIDATVADGPFPVMIFSHGYQGEVDNGTNLMAWFASHGWVVVAVEHTGNTTLDGPDAGSETLAQRHMDVSIALDHALDGDEMAAHTSPDHIFGTGHSFGGYTMFGVAGATWDVDRWEAECAAGASGRICSTWSSDIADELRGDLSDDRIGAFATYCGGNHETYGEGLGTVDKPLLQVSGALDGSVPNETQSDLIWNDLPAGDRIRVDLAHGDHQLATDFTNLAPGIIPGTHPDALSWERSYRITRIYTGAFAYHHLFGATEGLEGILDGTTVIDDDVTFSSK
jgi:predicted dienelactone hydrolase